jgi:hypothetical protein
MLDQNVFIKVCGAIVMHSVAVFIYFYFLRVFFFPPFFFFSDAARHQNRDTVVLMSSYMLGTRLLLAQKIAEELDGTQIYLDPRIKEAAWAVRLSAIKGYGVDDMSAFTDSMRKARVFVHRPHAFSKENLSDTVKVAKGSLRDPIVVVLQSAGFKKATEKHIHDDGGAIVRGRIFKCDYSDHSSVVELQNLVELAKNYGLELDGLTLLQEAEKPIDENVLDKYNLWHRRFR